VVVAATAAAAAAVAFSSSAQGLTLVHVRFQLEQLQDTFRVGLSWVTRWTEELKLS
jgi:hypothetical protein